jgi:hypothetical protein
LKQRLEVEPFFIYQTITFTPDRQSLSESSNRSGGFADN